MSRHLVRDASQVLVALTSIDVMKSRAMAAKKTPKKPSKSAFIRQQPAEMSVADVIAAGKAAGLKFTSSLVYMARGPKDGKTSTKKTAANKAVAKKTAGPKKVSAPKKTATSKKTAPKKTGESKAEFVRQHADLSPKEIVAKAKGEGINLGVTYVYNVRGADKASANKKGAAKKSAPSPRTSTAPKTTSTSTPKTVSNGTRPSSSVEDLLRAAAAELGLGKAIEILQGERARVRAVLGG